MSKAHFRRQTLLPCLLLLLAAAFALGYGARRVQAAEREPLALRVARRCNGEAHFALEPCACTVRNRLAGGWSERRVLEAYYAPDRAATAGDVGLVEEVLVGGFPCDPALWYMLGTGDLAYFGLDAADARLVVCDKEGVWCVLFYGRDAI